MTSQRTRDRLIERLSERGITDNTVLNVIRGTPRHIFLDEALSHRAYEDSSLPIGFQQTLSQPYIVARMTELLLANGPRERVLEVGTGSGYQTAILAQLVGRVFSVERIRPLQEKARQRLRQLGLTNVQLRHADGGMGWKDRGPFDAILSAAAPAEVPQELLAQLAMGGRLVIPIGPQGKQQALYVYDKTEEGIQEQIIEPVLFVPLLAGLLS
ncbi:protein-L-isoaspartate(D-aspartate) O-methyltransferase [gamma proteobacterium BDW918]|uniref:Protein-L-isoaspartate O-methyltransferase n=2 Tax=Zhongshania TaxID=1434050 RepID=A0A127M4I8_9GAMM|nr:MULTISPECIES: protein-L-isoaspartate(D-aspartate) O-methyltransferase [Zhongshania]AMO68147.1 protein-L-isoaspartate O-methyltransferase [Zhongshania aliphaticivorans]EIF44391.1 protein-L-isoaspartate(D-aspartate) O-methyltransferase [gamma proteobacterium BDW918]MBB5187326.1 protein-L-isoaspartate(D-aspartate) O-methyltransferase [Zhongshania antarctica]|tara:strand:- start:75208 stop:75846 length:639 start_codon:yes stop_codon:yes gene_type:complete